MDNAAFVAAEIADEKKTHMAMLASSIKMLDRTIMEFERLCETLGPEQLRLRLRKGLTLT